MAFLIHYRKQKNEQYLELFESKKHNKLFCEKITKSPVKFNQQYQKIKLHLKPIAQEKPQHKENVHRLDNLYIQTLDKLTTFLIISIEQIANLNL